MGYNELKNLDKIATIQKNYYQKCNKKQKLGHTAMIRSTKCAAKNFQANSQQYPGIEINHQYRSGVNGIFIVVCPYY